MKVLVNGIGNIGQTLLSLLIDYKTILNIDVVYALKNTEVSSWNRVEIDFLIKKGVVVCAKNNSEYINIDSIINDVDYIFDCNANSFGLKNKDWYNTLDNLKGCSAQGSEKGFGVPFMVEINNERIENEKFVQIVSCNTHSLSSIIMTLSNNNLSNFVEGDFVIVRRSEDLGNHQRLVSANVVSRHLEDTVGTHHSIDVKDLFETKNIKLNIQSSDITTPSQLMHSVRFNLKFKAEINTEQLHRQLIENPFISITSKFDSNIIFELGRRYSPYGRLFSHTIINDNNFLLDANNNAIKGWAFIPQEGNTIISTIAAYLYQLKISGRNEIIKKIRCELIKSEW